MVVKKGTKSSAKSAKGTKKRSSKSVELSQIIARNSIDGIAMAQEGRIIYVNEAYCKIFGYQEDELIGESMFKVVALEDVELISSRAQRRFAGESVLNRYVFKGLTRDGEKLLIEISSSECFLYNSKPTILSIFRDVTDNERIDRMIKESEEKFRMLAEQSPNMIFINKGGKVVYANRSCEEQMGYTRDEFYAPDFNFLTLIASEDQDKVLAAYAKHQQGAEIEKYEYDLVKKDGSRMTATISTKLIDYNGGKAILGIVTDITERKHAEEALRESRELYKSLVAASPDAVAMIDLEANLLYVSDKALELFGYSSQEEVLGKNALGFFDPGDYPKVMENLKKAREDGKTLRIEYTLIKRNGASFIGELSASVIKDNHGKPRAFIAIIRDITEQKSMQEAIRESERNYRTLVDNALIGVYKTNFNGEYLYANDAMAKIFEFRDAADMLKNNVITHYKEPLQRKAFLENIKSAGMVRDYELELVTSFGKNKSVLVSATVEGDILSGMMMDITERKLVEEQLLENVLKLQKLMESTIYAIARIVETRDPYTSGHQQRVADLVFALSKEMALSESQRLGLHLAAIIHDIGKISVPSEILTRPSRLSETEFALIKTHPEVGFDILRPIEFPWPVAEIVLQHHERLDGSGYPRGLRKNDILLEAKILAVADVVEAMSSHRPYRPSRGLAVTLKEISDNANILYDPEVVEVCLRLFDQGKFQFN
ncbi:MAG: hypothetical protein A2Y62_06915 [Candidatus Fischerbacteria bacterium RBG_13_37_8]|uniref:PAS domain S-box protein n=1 Tax=Candidatus Fischerbacteria bacterium RBG_13_37_8 TaxID=1817863 RepID=A0A1F5VM92_9BACT|nr:MAG: hypothetical protein A2Y62_06915 [Candidatus Fischerbacteria bacterium RBG_13_37_8]